MKRLKLLFCLMALAGFANATVYYVSATATGAGTGVSWADAFLSPAAALASATPVAGDEVWVKKGTYISAAQLSWKTGINFYGGFSGSELQRNERSLDASLTILEGTNTNKVLNAPIMASATTWDGFTIQKGLASGGGGGAFLQKNAIVQNCIFQNNKATSFGGGAIFIQGVSTDADSIKVLNCIIRNNVITYAGAAKRGGGGIYVKAGSFKAVIRGCTIEGNVADGLANTASDIDGGGVYLCDGVLENSTVKNNIVTNKNATSGVLSYTGKCQGGGVMIMPQTTTNPIVVRNCIVTGNASETSVGGGISIDPLWGSSLIAAPVTITNTMIVNNWAYKNGGGVMTDALNTASTSNYSFANCVIANNESSTVAAGGGGIFVNNIANYTGSVSFVNCTVVNNKMLTTNYGGAGIFYNNIKADITNSVFWGNGSVGTLAPVHVRVNGTLTTNKMLNCAFDNNFVESQVSPVGFACDLTGKVIVDLANTGSTMGSFYAAFVSPTNFIGKALAENDFVSLAAARWSLTSASAFIDAGTTVALSTDMVGTARPNHLLYDMGAYEFVSGNSTGIESVSAASSVYAVEGGLLVQVADAKGIDVKVYNLMGALIQQLRTTKETTFVSLPTHQLYIVRVGTKTQKLLVK